MSTVTITKIEQKHELDPEDQSKIGVRAVAHIEIPYEDHVITHRIASPGLWDIDLLSSEEYLAEIYADEREILLHMLRAIGLETATVAASAD